MTALVSQAIHQARFLEQLVELRTMRLGNFLSQRFDSRVRTARGRFASVDRSADRFDEKMGQLERVLSADVIAERAVTHDIEVGRKRSCDRTAACFEPIE